MDRRTFLAMAAVLGSRPSAVFAAPAAAIVAPSVAAPAVAPLGVAAGSTTSLHAVIAAGRFDPDAIGSMRRRPEMYLTRRDPVGAPAGTWRAPGAADFAVDVIRWRILRTIDAEGDRLRITVSDRGLHIVDAGIAQANDVPRCQEDAARDPWDATFEALYLAAYSGQVGLWRDETGLHHTYVRPEPAAFAELALEVHDLASRLETVYFHSDRVPRHFSVEFTGSEARTAPVGLAWHLPPRTDESAPADDLGQRLFRDDLPFTRLRRVPGPAQRPDRIMDDPARAWDRRA